MFLVGHGSKWAKRSIFSQKCNFDLKIWIVGDNSQLFVLELRILSTGHITSITSIPRATTFPFDHPEEIFRFRPGPGPKTRIAAQKSVFSYRTPNFVNGPFVALGETVHFQHSINFSTFRFRVTSVLADAPHHTVGAPSAINSPSAQAWSDDN